MKFAEESSPERKCFLELRMERTVLRALFDPEVGVADWTRCILGIGEIWMSDW